MLRAILVDDEPKSLKSLETLLSHYCPQVKVVGTSTSAFDALGLIANERPELVFLDIHMPEHTGMDLIKKINAMPLKVVFTTGDSNQAMAAIKNGAFDYLLKPIDADDLVRCLNRIEPVQKPKLPSSSIQINVKEGVLFVNTSDIIKLKASGSYTDIYLEENKKLTTSKVLKDYESMLDRNQFYRCHNSYIINLRKVEKLLNEDGYFVSFKDGSRAEVTRKNKDELIEKMRALT
ncbi:MAG TPA: LytTR family DNA-binding domain-containing protein [Flavobacteriales bacterium]|nr:LytTR family DNA-binding domain-containing protein [Flavobacteriales bacterium]